MLIVFKLKERKKSLPDLHIYDDDVYSKGVEMWNAYMIENERSHPAHSTLCGGGGGADVLLLFFSSSSAY